MIYTSLVIGDRHHLMARIHTSPGHRSSLPPKEDPPPKKAESRPTVSATSKLQQVKPLSIRQMPVVVYLSFLENMDHSLSL